VSMLAVKTRGLGKRYARGETRSADPNPTLREALAHLPTRALAAIKRGPGESRRSNTFWALKDVSFQVEQGETLAIIGRNGAGKSTLLKILSRVIAPTEGYAEVLGRVGALLQVGIGFHPDLSGRENIFLNAAVLGISRQRIARKFDEIVEFAEIRPFLDTPVKRYSSGMYVRLAFSVASHIEPDVLIVDEVLSVGDLGFQRKSLAKIAEIMRDGRTVLLVSHSMQTVRAVAHQAIWLEEGGLRQIGPADEVSLAYEKSFNEAGS
jgi:lipopolysaccharide transport system ATP-binding protein